MAGLVEAFESAKISVREETLDGGYLCIAPDTWYDKSMGDFETPMATGKTREEARAGLESVLAAHWQSIISIQPELAPIADKLLQTAAKPSKPGM